MKIGNGVFAMRAGLFALALLCAVPQLSAAQGGSRAKKGEIPEFASRVPFFKIVLLRTPQIRFYGAADTSKLSKDSYWVGIELIYTAAFNKKEKAFLDDVRVVGTVALESCDSKGRPVPAVYTGEFRLWNIPCDGRERKMFMAIPPQLVNRYTKPGLNVGKSIIMARLQVYSDKGVLLADEYAYLNKSVKMDEVKAVFRNLDANPKMGIRIHGGLLPRSRTPWTLLDSSYYDLEKDPIARPAPSEVPVADSGTGAADTNESNNGK